MATKTRPVDAAAANALDQIRRAGREIRAARTDRGLSLRDVGAACGISESEVSRIERALRPGVGFVDLARLHAAVGLEAHSGPIRAVDRSGMWLTSRFSTPFALSCIGA